MHFMLLIAHGSRNQNANEEVKRLAERVYAQSKNHYEAVIPAFLEFAEPDIITGIGQCIERGASRITAMPYFLSAGNHVGRDIPAQIELARSAHPDIDIEQAPHIGSVDSMASLVAECTHEK